MALLLGGFGASAQRLSGRVLDAVTGQPVPYASISVPGASQGTTGNAEGEFEMALKLPVRLIVSELGHRADTLAVAVGQKQLVVRLQPAAVELPDVVPGAYTVELLKKAYRHLQRVNRPRYGQAFYRQITRLDNEPAEVLEMVWHTKANGVGIEETAPNQGRYAEKKALLKFKDFSLYTRAINFISQGTDSTATDAILSLNPTADMTLRLIGLSTDGKRELADIGFASKTHPEKVFGSFLIDTETYQLLRCRFVTPAFGSRTKNPLFKFKDSRTSLEWVFKPLDDGSTILDYYKIDHQQTLERKLKPDVAVQVSAFTIFYDGQLKPTANVSYQRGKKGDGTDLQAIKALPYDAAFWQNNSVVKRTPLEDATIKAFEQKGAFGTLLTP
ncbi:carboxypeptidase-like regulatory domain-containing protein [Hymenobacter terrestris]|uniref:carboxypeptidase-like regulatory domain-containing protein n=1 Tax=Hymenobacter terrestris TaxID=2748310 RepID=UPI0015A215EB|nr:carboxypeptidase-like regulatory domain-containing protein [Hymenobacter terrestris]